ncbi:DNA-directed RNA polymerase subunit L [Candidatus Woesearchaeota archaeon]|nr:DNA-directed RNA polymerase subunit L [Candidatus Woesearchaeota archaeon]
MEIGFLKDEKDKVEFTIKGEDHTLCNFLRKELWSDSDVDIAAYSIDHPLVSNPVMLVETKKSDAKKAVLKAAGELRKTISELKKSVNSSL